MLNSNFQLWIHKESQQIYIVLPTANGCQMKNPITRKWEECVMYQKIDSETLVEKSPVYIREFKDFREKFEFKDSIKRKDK